MKYRSLLLAGAALQAGAVHAMGLGNITVESHLGAPLDAQITLLSQEEFSQSDVKINLANADVYARFGARNLVDHGAMRFDVAVNDQGALTARIISTKRIQEPYVDMVVELRWPGGTTYRRYEVLLDPPQQNVNLSAAIHPVAVRPSLALQPVKPEPMLQSKPIATSKAIATAATKPVDTVNSLKAELLRLQRERAILLARRNAIRTELNTLKQVQVIVANEALDSATPVYETVSVSVDDVPVNLKQNIPVVVNTPVINSEVSTVAATPLPVAVQQSAIPLSSNIGLPIPPGALLQRLTAQDLISSKNAVQAAVDENGRSGFWYLLALLPLSFMLAFFFMRAHWVKREKHGEHIKDENLYELVFGAQRDRNRTENKTQVVKALENIKAKALRYENGSKNVTQILREEVEDASLFDEVFLTDMDTDSQNDWMVDAPIRNLGR